MPSLSPRPSPLVSVRVLAVVAAAAVVVVVVAAAAAVVAVVIVVVVAAVVLAVTAGLLEADYLKEKINK